MFDTQIAIMSKVSKTQVAERRTVAIDPFCSIDFSTFSGALSHNTKKHKSGNFKLLRFRILTMWFFQIHAGQKLLNQKIIKASIFCTEVTSSQKKVNLPINKIPIFIARGPLEVRKNTPRAFFSLKMKE